MVAPSGVFPREPTALHVGSSRRKGSAHLHAARRSKGLEVALGDERRLSCSHFGPFSIRTLAPAPTFPVGE